MLYPSFVTGKNAEKITAYYKNRLFLQLLLFFFLSSFIFSSPVYAGTPILNVTITQSAGATIESGKDFTYVLSYSCASTDTDCTNVHLIDDLPDTLEFVSIELPGDVDKPDSTIPTAGQIGPVIDLKLENNGTALAAGSTGIVTITVRFPAGTLPGTQADNKGDLTADNATNVSTVTVTTEATGIFEMYAEKTGPALVVLNNNATFDLKICSPDAIGGVKLTNPVIIETVPAEAIFVTAQGTETVDWTYNSGTREVTFINLPTIEVGGCTSRSVTLKYDHIPTPANQTNGMTAIGDPEDGTPSVTLNDSVGFGVIVPYASGTGSKSSTAPSSYTGTEAKQLEEVTYTISTSNTGYLPIDNIIVDDEIPTEVDLVSWQISVPPAGSVTASYQINNGGWVQLSDSPFSSSTLITSAHPDLTTNFDQVTDIRWEIGTLDIGDSWSANVIADVDIVNSPGGAFNNCIDINSTTLVDSGTPENLLDDAPLVIHTCNTVNVIDDRVIPRLTKNGTGAPLRPGDIQTFTVTLNNDQVAHLNLINPVVADLLPSDFIYVANSASTSVGTDVGTEPMPVVNPVETIADYNSIGQTLLRWSWIGDLEPNETLTMTYDVKIADGFTANLNGDTPSISTPGTYTNHAALVAWGVENDPDTTPGDFLGCTGAEQYIDTGDLDGDSDAGEVSCQASFDTTVGVFLSAKSGKLVLGTVDYTTYGTPVRETDPAPLTEFYGNTDFNKLGLTVPGGEVSYLLQIENNSNVPLTHVTLTDIMPFVGDTGVIDPSQRGSQWRPNLQSAVVPLGTPSPFYTVYYSIEENPCRDELTASAGCVDDWTTTLPADPTTVQAVKIDFCNGGSCTALPIGSTLTFGWRMSAPFSAPADADCSPPLGDTFDYSTPGNCKIAWNTFGFTAYQDLGGGSKGLKLLPAEPVRVGMRVAPVAIATAAVGNLVWLDVAGEEKDGIQQTIEQDIWGVSGVQVDLYNSANALIETQFTGPDHDGKPGHYFFSHLIPGDYYIRFFPPAGFDVINDVTLQQGDLSNVKDANDSDGATQSGLYYQTPTFSLAPDEIDNSWDFGLWLDTDYGDAPNTYPVDNTVNDAGRHIIGDTLTGFDLKMGASVDAELNGPATATALGDDLAGDDENGVTFAQYIGTPAEPIAILEKDNDEEVTVTVTEPANGTGYLSAWVDFNANGIWEHPGELVATNLTATTGEIKFNIRAPNTATYGTTYARFRFSSEQDLTPEGTSKDGEVEDYQVQIISRPAKTNEDTSEPGSTSPRVASGEIIEYDLKVSLPEGNLGDVTIRDFLPSGLTYVTNSVVITADTGITHGGISESIVPSTNDPQFVLTSVVNSDTDSGEEFIILTIHAIADNSCTTGRSTRFRNNFRTSFGNYSRTSNNQDTRLIKANVSISTTLLTLPNPLGPGSKVQYDIVVSNDNHSYGDVAYDLVVTDTLPAGLVNLSVVSTSGAAPTYTIDSGTETLTTHAINLAKNSSFTIRVQAILTTAIAPANSINNTATVDWSSLDGSGSNLGASSPGTDCSGNRNNSAAFTAQADYGDVPDSYATNLANNSGEGIGAHHIVPVDASGNPTHYLGAGIDTENDGQPSVDTKGDDNSNGDEDGISLPTPLYMDQSYAITVTSTAQCSHLNGWIDFNKDGDFLGANEHIIINHGRTSSPEVINFTPASDADTVNGVTYARFRCNSAPGLASNGPASDGEVEDYLVVIQNISSNKVDYGDAPDASIGQGLGNYQTTRDDNGASHGLGETDGPFLGACVDGDNGDLQDPLAVDDDITGSLNVHGSCSGIDDEDGVIFPTQMIAGQAATINVSASTGVVSNNSCQLNAWIDYNQNGVWEAGEQIANDVVIATNSSTNITPTLSAGAVFGYTYARFRCSTAGGDSPVGAAFDGEVEDYRILIEPDVNNVALDYGDAPDTTASTARKDYTTTDTNIGARHILLNSAPYLGSYKKNWK